MMNSKQFNPNIRVTPETRKDLKVIAAHTGETMLEVVARLAKQELERLKRQSKSEW
jgi:predicted DNA-binding protein